MHSRLKWRSAPEARFSDARHPTKFAQSYS
ncbi:Uncharacterised protein [Vibrio cholerae]|nr:Uncharacterised protein [Vibrio cholerae]